MGEQGGQPREPVGLIRPQVSPQAGRHGNRFQTPQSAQSVDLASPLVGLPRHYPELGELVEQLGLEPADPGWPSSASVSARASSISWRSFTSSGLSSAK